MARTSVQLVALGASLRSASTNLHLLDHCCSRLGKTGAKIDRVDYRELVAGTPDYDQDIEDDTGIPAAIEHLADLISGSDGLLLASPEYNHSMPGGLKNAIDWLSRMKPVPLDGKVACLVSASPSMVGGYRGLQSLRVPLEALGTLVLPGMFALAQVRDGAAIDAALAKATTSHRLDALLGELGRVSYALRPAPSSSGKSRSKARRNLTTEL